MKEDLLPPPFWFTLGFLVGVSYMLAVPHILTAWEKLFGKK